MWRGAHLPFSLSSLSFSCFEWFLSSRFGLALSVSRTSFWKC